MSQSSSPFTVDPQTLLHLKAALIDFRLRTPACSECGRDTEMPPTEEESQPVRRVLLWNKHDPDCSFGRAVHLVDQMLSDEYQDAFIKARLRCEAAARHH